MKLNLNVHDDPVERVALGIHTSVMERLRLYKAFYEQGLNGKIQQNYFVEEMLKTVMQEDKDFQKYLKEVNKLPKEDPASAV